MILFLELKTIVVIVPLVIINTFKFNTMNVNLDWLNFDVNMRIELRDENGNLKEERLIHNAVAAAGKNMIAERVEPSPSINAPSHMAIGTGSHTPGTSTALGTELDRNAFGSGPTAAANVVTMVGSWAAGDGTGAITEAGCFNASSAGSLLWSATFSVINKGASDTLQITWTVTIS